MAGCCILFLITKFTSYIQTTTSVHLVLITVMTMRRVLIQMDHILALVTLDIMETEWIVQVSRNYYFSCLKWNFLFVVVFSRYYCRECLITLKCLLFEYCWPCLGIMFFFVDEVWNLIVCVLIFQITTSVLLELIIVITMRHVLIRMDHLLALVTLDILETEWHVQVGRKYFVLLLVKPFAGCCIFLDFILEYS